MSHYVIKFPSRETAAGRYFSGEDESCPLYVDIGKARRFPTRYQADKCAAFYWQRFAFTIERVHDLLDGSPEVSAEPNSLLSEALVALRLAEATLDSVKTAESGLPLVYCLNRVRAVLAKAPKGLDASPSP